MKTITIEGQLRTEHGKSATRQLRSQELVPGVIYGGAQEINFSAPATAFKPLVYTPNFQIAEVNVDNLEIGGNIRVEDVKEENYEILNSPRIPIASVVTTRALRQEEATAPAAKGAAPAAPAKAAPAKK